MTIELTIPTGINSLYKQGRHGWFKDKKAVDWQEQALYSLISYKNRHTTKCDSVYITWYFKDKRKHDIDGPIKLLLDTLVKAKLISDDNDITFLQVQKQKSDRNYCTVELP